MDKTAVRLVSAFDTIDELVFCGLMLTIPFGWQASIVPNILFIILLIRKAVVDLRQPSNEKLWYFMPVFALFFVSIVSLTYSDNVGYGLDVLFKRLNLLILPIGFLLVDFSPSLAKRGMRFFVLGAFISAAIGLSIALSNSIILKEQMLCIAPYFDVVANRILDTDIHNNYFLGVNLSVFMHPAYYGFLMAIAMIGLLNSYVKEQKSWIIEKGIVPGIVFIGLSLVLLSTNGVIITALFLVFYSLVFAFLKRESAEMFSSWLVVFALLLATALFFNPQVRVLLNDNDVISLQDKKDASRAAINIIEDHAFFGVGLGDLDDALMEQYHEMGLTRHQQSVTNPHNQFLQTFATLGVAGFLALLWMFFSIFKYGIKKKSILLLGFVIVAIIGFFFESMLNRYWGILSFSIFYCILYYLPIEIEE